MNCSCSRSSRLATAKVVSIWVSVTVVLLFFLAFFCSGFHAKEPIGVPTDQTSSVVGFHEQRSLAHAAYNRKLLREHPKGLSSISPSPSTSKRPDNTGEKCTKNDIVMHQGATAPMPNGIPTYTVEILNVCETCNMTNIHLSCGWFSSARLINPRVFRRLRHNDCLVNDGRPLPPGYSISFQYANSFRYPLSVTSASCAS